MCTFFPTWCYTMRRFLRMVYHRHKLLMWSMNCKKLLHAKQISSGFTVVHWNTCTLYLTKKPFNISYLGFQGNLETGMLQKKIILPSLSLLSCKYRHTYNQLHYVRIFLIILTDLFIMHVRIIRVCKRYGEIGLGWV